MRIAKIDGLMTLCHRRTVTMIDISEQLGSSIKDNFIGAKQDRHWKCAMGE